MIKTPFIVISVLQIKNQEEMIMKVAPSNQNACMIMSWDGNTTVKKLEFRPMLFI